MNIAICDDEQKYIDEIRGCLDAYGRKNNISFDIYEFTSGKELIECDLIFSIAFLDIEVGDVSGIDIGRKLKQNNNNIILMCVTAYNHYLDDALDLGIIRYFNKPIDEKRLMKGIEKAVSIVDETEVKIELKDDDNNVNYLKCKDIVFVEITGRNTTVHTINGDYKSNDTMKDWVQRLNKSYFISPHKSFWVNINYITSYTREYVVLNNKYKIPISYRKRSDIRQKVMRNMENY